MDKDSKSKIWEEIWEQLSKIRFWVAIAAIPFSFFLYVLLGSSHLPEGSWLAPGREYLMALITNFVPTCLIIVVGYVLLRKLQTIKSKQERDALLTEIREETRNVVEGELRTIQQTIDKFFTQNELGNTVHSLGIANITGNWVELLHSQQPLGANFRHRLSNVKFPATWYILTITPTALRVFDEEIKGAVKRGVNVKWAYYAPNAIDANPAIKTQWECISRYPGRTESSNREGLKNRISSLLDDLGTSLRNEIYKLGKEHQKDGGNLEFYESEMMHPYLAFLSVPEEYKELPQDALPERAPVGTFGFVHLYPIFQRSFDERPALYLDASGGKILDEYYWSTLRLFDWGVRQGKIRRTWSLKT